jgi:hypothetical protein
VSNLITKIDAVEFQLLSLNSYILGDTSEIAAQLDESLVTINTVLGSRYCKGIKDKVIQISNGFDSPGGRLHTPERCPRLG